MIATPALDDLAAQLYPVVAKCLAQPDGARAAWAIVLAYADEADAAHRADMNATYTPATGVLRVVGVA